MTVDLSGLPVFPDTAAFRDAARAIEDAGKALATNAGEVRTAWAELGANGYITSDTLDMTAVHAAADPVVDYGDASESGTHAVYLAIDA